MNIAVNHIYEHYRGNKYLVVDIATNTDTDEEMVVYRALYGKHLLYTQPSKRFLEEVDKPEFDYHGPRMRRIEIQEQAAK
jgi:hypothetical protein